MREAANGEVYLQPLKIAYIAIGNRFEFAFCLRNKTKYVSLAKNIAPLLYKMLSAEVSRSRIRASERRHTSARKIISRILVAQKLYDTQVGILSKPKINPLRRKIAWFLLVHHASGFLRTNDGSSFVSAILISPLWLFTDENNLSPTTCL